MRNVSRRKPFHRHILVATVFTLIAAPVAFSHNHTSDSHRVAAHSGSSRHHARNDRADTRYNRTRDDDAPAVAALSDRRRHERVPDEEELEQAEQ